MDGCRNASDRHGLYQVFCSREGILHVFPCCLPNHVFQLIVSSPNSSAETVELDDQEIIVVSTNEAQRQLALSRYAAAGQSKSRSPRRSKRERPNTNTQLPSPPRS